MFQSKFSKTDLKNEKCAQKNHIIYKKLFENFSLRSFCFKTAELTLLHLKEILTWEYQIKQITNEALHGCADCVEQRQT